MELTVNLNEQEANLILAGLAELPAKHSLELIFKFKKQCDDQLNPAPAPEPSPAPETDPTKKEGPTP